MKRIAIIVLVLVGCLIHSTVAEAQSIKDAFVLIDVSGTMRHAPNNEAKQIINKMLQRNFRLLEYPEWSLYNGECPFSPDNGKSLIELGGKVCIVPFGNQGTIEHSRFVEMSDFDKSFNSLFPETFNDNATFLTLAKAYTVDLASKNRINGTVYMIIYTDGMGDHMKEQVWDKYEKIYQDFGLTLESLAQKIGTLKKEVGSKKFYIEMWELGPIPVDNPCPKCGKNPCVCPPTLVCPKCKKSPCVCPSQTNIQITKPKEGKVKSNEIKVNTEESTKLSWKNGKGKVNVKIAYSSDSGKSYMPIRKKDEKEYFSKGEKVGNMEITFHRPGKYQVKVIDSNNTDDSRFYSVSEPLINKILPFIIIVILIIGGVYLWKLLSKAKPVPGPIWGPDNDGGGNSGNNNDDWN